MHYHIPVIASLKTCSLEYNDAATINDHFRGTMGCQHDRNEVVVTPRASKSIVLSATPIGLCRVQMGSGLVRHSCGRYCHLSPTEYTILSLVSVANHNKKMTVDLSVLWSASTRVQNPIFETMLCVSALMYFSSNEKPAPSD